MIYYISFALILSVIGNIFFFIYSRWLIRKIAENQLFVEDIWKLISDFSKHLKVVNEMEMFYGDETLKGLILHSSEIVEILEEHELILATDDNIVTDPNPTTEEINEKDPEEKS